MAHERSSNWRRRPVQEQQTRGSGAQGRLHFCVVISLIRAQSPCPRRGLFWAGGGTSQSALTGSARARPEGEGFLPGIQHKSCDEIIAQALCQVMQTSEVLLARGGGGLDLNAGYLALAALQHGVDLDVVFGAVME